jgi:hypothetical protein
MKVIETPAAETKTMNNIRACNLSSIRYVVELKVAYSVSGTSNPDFTNPDLDELNEDSSIAEEGHYECFDCYADESGTQFLGSWENVRVHLNDKGIKPSTPRYVN